MTRRWSCGSVSVMPRSKEVRFGGFRLDTANEQLWRGEQVVALRPKAFAVLGHLVAHAGELVTKQQLLDAVWPGTFVGDAVLKDCIRQVREALGDDAASPRFVETAHRRGYRFIGRLDASAAVPARQTRVLGRETELAFMDECLDRAGRGERQIVFVTGEPGIGKTTLVRAVREAAAGRGMWVAWGQCVEQFGRSEAYLPVLDGLSRLGRTEAGARLAELVREHAPSWLRELPALVPAGEREDVRASERGGAREPTLRELADAIEAVTADSPLLIVLEDLHWSDYSTVNLITYLARRREPARLMVIGTYRPSDVILVEHPIKGVKRELQAHGLCRDLPLGYLTEAAVEEHLTLTLPGHRFPKWLARLIHRRTEGNPLFMVNLVEYLLADRIIVRDGSSWRLQGEFGSIDSGIPDSVRQLIERQLDRLSADERRVLEGASVVGMECSSAAISAALDEPAEWVELHCEALVRRHQFLLPARLVELPDGTPTSRYKFNHVLYLEATYQLIPAMRRSQMHSRVGRAGEAIYGTRVGEIAAELAMHFEQGNDGPRAVCYLLQAAENARYRSAHHEAETLSRRGLSALVGLPPSPERDQRELDLRTILGASTLALEDYAAGVKDV